LCDGITRREALRVGGLGFTGLLWSDWLRARAAHADQSNSDRKSAARFGKAKACILIFNYGGPSHLDTWDLKPDAPKEIRGEFKPAATRVPGIAITAKSAPWTGSNAAPVDLNPTRQPSSYLRGRQRPAATEQRRGQERSPDDKRHNAEGPLRPLVPAEIRDEIPSPLTGHAVHDLERFRIAAGLSERSYRRKQEKNPAQRQHRPSAGGRRGGPGSRCAAPR
jgi:hypothetical protein